MSAFGNDVTLVEPGTVVTATGNAPLVIDPVNKGTLRAVLNVTAASGTTPSLTVNVQTSYDNGDTDAWHTVASFTAATATGVQRKTFAIDRYVRVTYTVSGTTPSFTIGVTGETV